jgi:hypothetical protein
VREGLGADTVRKARDERTEHALCRKALEDWGATSEVESLDNEFTLIRYFSCSTLGRAPDDSGRPFVPDRVLRPVAWLLRVDGTNPTWDG